MKFTGAQILLRQLIHQGIDTVFGYPGGTIMPVYDALLDHGEHLTHFRLSHEQGVVHAADGYARTKGKPGICFVTSGPGATNTVTGIATAFMDSVPLVLFTGQVPRALFGTDSFQEIDITSICEAITKKTYRVLDIDDLARIVSEAITIASTGRPGPVLVDLPKDLLLEETDYHPILSELTSTRAPSENLIAQAAAMINTASRPVIYAGGGVRRAGASQMLIRLAERTGIPVANSLMGLGTFPMTHPLSLGLSGMHGRQETNSAITHCDLLLVIGARFSDRAIGIADAFAPQATIIHLDIDDTEFLKNVDSHLHIPGNLTGMIKNLLYYIEENDHAPWREWIGSQKPPAPSPENFCPENIIRTIDVMTPDNAILATDTGQHQMWAAQHWRFNRPDSLVTSGGLGTMGYGLSGAIGAQIAAPGRPVVLVTGDGGFRMCAQELLSVSNNQLPITIILLNNRSLGMVRQWQKIFNQRRFSEIDNSSEPDYVHLCQAYGIPGTRVETLQALREAMIRRQETQGPFFIEVLINPESDVYPFVPPGKPLNEALTG